MSKQNTKARAAALWLKADGTQEEVYPKGDKWTLEELQAKVGGFIERVPRIPGMMLAVRQDMWVDEEGLLKGKPQNARASVVAGQLIVGDALIVEEGQLE